MPSATALIVAASRGLGLGLAREYLGRGWAVIGTVRGAGRTELHDLLDGSNGALEIVDLDITMPEQVQRLRATLAGRTLDLLFVNAGIANGPGETLNTTPTDEFVRVMVTNALSPMRVVEAIADLVAPRGVVAVMSSGLGSVANNTRGGWEVYRASKAALNTLMRSLVARRAGDTRTFLVVAPGWVRTDMGGPDALLDIATSVSGIADAIAARAGTGGVTYIDYRNQIVPW